jgi:hypothetical protein
MGNRLRCCLAGGICKAAFPGKRVKVGQLVDMH